MSVNIGVRTWDMYWADCPVEKRHALLDDKEAWETRLRGGKRYISKRRAIVICLQSLLRLKRWEDIEQIYSLLRSDFNLKESDELYLSILHWIEQNMKNGHVGDFYWIYSAIASYYRDTKQIQKALEYDEREYIMHGAILKDLSIEEDESLINGLYSAPITFYIYDLNAVHDFEKSRFIQEESLRLGYLDAEKSRQDKTELAYCWYRWESEWEYHKKNKTVPDTIDDILTLEKFPEVEYAATAYKRLADLYYVIEDYEHAVMYYRKALDLWPQVYAAQTKLNGALKRLNKGA